MNERGDASLLWAKAKEDADAARALLNVSCSGVANRAYYAVFHAVSALLFLEGKENLFKKHQAVESAVHRDLVQTGRWTKEIGSAYSSIFELRLSGDYGIAHNISEDEAETAISNMEMVLHAVSVLYPDFFKL